MTALQKSPVEECCTSIARAVADEAGGASQLDFAELIEMLGDLLKFIEPLFTLLCGKESSADSLRDGTAFAKFAANPSWDAQVRLRGMVYERLGERGLRGRFASARIARAMIRQANENPAETAKLYRELRRPDFGVYTIPTFNEGT